ncbi:putative MFS family arabinose efflux permease [Actinocrispum wychmicini]|uniref:Putative MFS family arabinose efflux permease n=2 Tax=Actinocrispum wychmicini TaxID=1213861 RepID=A0A4V6NP44_9PSEU|nr:putative MFS family arabinose efflux permease [Actinocrispum wychmicini]
MDLRPLGESSAFRRLWLGGLLSVIGSQMTTFAVALQVYTITRSAIAVGGVGLAAGIPAIVFGLIGGSVVDAVDRRKLMLLTSSLLAAVSAAFAWQALAGNGQVWPLYLLIVVQSTIASVNSAALRTFAPRLLPPELLPAGAALNVFAFHGSMIIGPPIAGLIAAGWGLRGCYLVDLVSFAGALYGIARLPPMRPRGTPTRPGLRSVLAGLRFIKGSRVITGAFLADVNATALGMPFALFPAVNAEHFGGDPKTLGLLNAAPAIGGVIGSVLSGPMRHVRRQGLAMLVAGGVWGLGVLGFGLAPTLGVAIASLALAGAADAISVVCWSAMVQVLTPDEFRGRVAAAEIVVGAGVPQLGNFRAGAVASLTTPAAGAVIGGVSVIGGAVLIGLFVPALVRYRTTR